MTYVVPFRKILVEDPSNLTAEVEYENGLFLRVQYCPGKDIEEFSEANTRKRSGSSVTDISNDKEREFWLDHWVGWRGLADRDNAGTVTPIPHDAKDEVVIRLCAETNQALAEAAQAEGKRPPPQMTPDQYLRWIKESMWNNLGIDFRAFLRRSCQELSNFR